MSGTPIGFPPQRSEAILRRLLTELRDTADTRRKEAITGRFADPVRALEGRVREPLEIERAIRSISLRRDSIALAEIRAQTTQAVLGTLSDTVNDVSNQTALALQNGTESGLQIASATARDSLAAAVSALNSRAGGRAVFSGDAGDRPALTTAETIRAEVVALIEAAPNAGIALADIAAAFDGAGGLFETTLYQGGTGEAPDIELAEDERLSYQVRADAPVFRDILRSLAIISAANDPDVAIPAEDRRALTEAATLDLRNTTDPLNRVVARIGAAEARIETVKARLVSEETALTAGYNELAGADTLTAATDLQAIEGQLEILFLTTARLQDLTLGNFLR